MHAKSKNIKWGAETHRLAHPALELDDRVDDVDREARHIHRLGHIVQARLRRLDDRRQVAVGELAEPCDTAHLLEVLGEGKVGDRVLDGRAREGDGQRHRREEVRHEQLEDALPLDVALRLVRHRIDVLRGERREEQQRRLVDGRLRVADERADRGNEGVLAQLGAELPRLLALELVGELRELGEAIREVLRLLRAQERREGQGDVARRVLVLVVHAGGGAGGGLGRDGRGLGRHSSAWRVFVRFARWKRRL